MWTYSNLTKAAAIAAAMALTPVAAQAAYDVGATPLGQGASGAGYDLLYTVSAEYNLPGEGVVQFEGVPITSFNFPGPDARNPIGGLGNTDTILRRNQVASRASMDAGPADNNSISVEIIALQLRSINAVGLFGEKIETRNVTDLGSTMDIFFNAAGDGGTFDSNLVFNFDFFGVTSGVELVSDVVVNFVQTGTDWTRDPDPGTPVIFDINRFVNGSDNSADFFTGLAMHGPDHMHKTDGGAQDNFTPPVPTPATIPLLAGVAAVFGIARLRRSRTA